MRAGPSCQYPSKPKRRIRPDLEELNLLKRYPQDGKERLMVFGNDLTRNILVPDRNQVHTKVNVSNSQYVALRDMTANTPQEMNRELIDRINMNKMLKAKQFRDQLQSFEIKRKEKSKPKLDKDHLIRESYLKKRSEHLRAEEEDVIKVINSEITKAKCMTVVKNQMEQNAVQREKIQKTLEQQNKEIVETDNALYQQLKAEENTRKKETLETSSKILAEQMKMIETKRSIQKAEIGKEKKLMEVLMVEENRKNRQKLEKKQQDKMNLLNHQKEMILKAQILKEKELLEDEMINQEIEKIRNQQYEQNRITQEKLLKSLRERNSATEDIYRKIIEKQNLEYEAEKLEIELSDNKAERKWREKEKERVLKAIETKKQLRDEIEKQIDEKYKLQTCEILADTEEARKLELKMKESEKASQEEKNKVQEKNEQLLKNLNEGVEEKRKLKMKEQEREERFRAVMKENERKEREYWKTKLDEKIREMEQFAIDEKFVNNVKRKAEELKAKQLGDK